MSIDMKKRLEETIARIEDDQQAQQEDQRKMWVETMAPKNHVAENKPFDFNDVVDHRITEIRRILISKAKEYATDGDRFHNFRAAGRMLDTTPEIALMGMRAKHEVSVMDLVEIAASRPCDLSVELIEEKIGDNINYLILLEGLLKEKINEYSRIKGQIEDLEQCQKR